mmetsp:Transcript_88452/g.162432  ORF Transcript_88452/g.162432 Transcript_88452/m.162432 type:complete len:235 (+) Transcript_88452:694-1398(+)
MPVVDVTGWWLISSGNDPATVDQFTTCKSASWYGRDSTCPTRTAIKALTIMKLSGASTAMQTAKLITLSLKKTATWLVKRKMPTKVIKRLIVTNPPTPAAAIETCPRNVWAALSYSWWFTNPNACMKTQNASLRSHFSAAAAMLDHTWRKTRRLMGTNANTNTDPLIAVLRRGPNSWQANTPSPGFSKHSRRRSRDFSSAATATAFDRRHRTVKKSNMVPPSTLTMHACMTWSR